MLTSQMGIAWDNVAYSLIDKRQTYQITSNGMWRNISMVILCVNNSERFQWKHDHFDFLFKIQGFFEQ